MRAISSLIKEVAMLRKHLDENVGNYYHLLAKLELGNFVLTQQNARKFICT